MAYGFTSPGANAGNAILQFLMQREEEKRRQLIDQASARESEQAMGLRERQMSLQEQERIDRLTRQAQIDQASADEKATASRAQQNQIGVRGMMADAMTQGPMTPDAAKTIGIMAFREGMQPPDDVARMLEPEPEPETFTLGEGQARFDANGNVVARGPARRDPQSARPQQEWVIRNGQPVPIQAGSAQHGDRPYDPVAARTSQPENRAEAVDTAREVQRISGALRNHGGFAGTFGKFDAMKPNLLSSQDTIDSRTLLNSLKGLLTIENMGKMKGVLSDADMRILQQASTTLDAAMSEDAAAAELDRLVQVMSKVAGGGSQSAPQSAPADDGWMNVNGARIRKKR